MADVRSAVAKVPLPASVRLEFGGQYASQQQSFRELLVVMGLAIGAVLAVLVTQFRGFRGPLAIVLVVPLGLTGAIIMLAATGVPFNVSSFMGVILLVGLIVKNGILLLDAAVRSRDEDLPVVEALIRAGQIAATANPHDHALHPGGSHTSRSRSWRRRGASATLGARGDRRPCRLNRGDSPDPSNHARPPRRPPTPWLIRPIY